MKPKSGFTLIEVIIATAIFALVALALYQSFFAVMTIIKSSEAKTTAVLLVNEQIEIIRNLPYSAVGLLGGTPPGLISRYQTITRNGMQFNLEFSIQDIDDSFDGQFGSSTHNDLAAADYKRLEIEIGCPGCRNFSTTSVTTTIAPKNLENSSNNGALVVKIFDALGQPVPQAQVRIINTAVSPTININEVADNTGTFQLVSTPPANLSYQIQVTKSGYSIAKTYTIGDPANPNPLDRHATVVSAQVTQKSFVIDRLGQLAVRTVNDLCQPVGGTTLTIWGTKLIGTSPDVLKFPATNYLTDGDGQKSLTALEWDSYSFSLASSAHDLGGIMPLLPISLAPAGNQAVTLVMAARNPNSLLVTVRDNNNLPIDDAQVVLTRSGFSDTKTTNRGFSGQTNWQAGPGQIEATDENKFFEADTGLDYGQLGLLSLASSSGNYFPAGVLTSSSFDTGSSSTVFDSLVWSPTSQPVGVGAGSVKFQLATTDDPATTTWDFVGPDGTAGSYFTDSGTKIPTNLNNKRYLRYRLSLATASSTVTPTVTSLNTTFSSECTPFGQVLFTGLSADSYSINVTHDDYNSYTNSGITVGTGWQALNITLTPK